jgi:hypothetical protein
MWSDIKAAIAKFIGCYWTITYLDESGKTKDDIVCDAMNLHQKKCGKAFVFNIVGCC